uniref:Glutamic-oxaloacetic transaminase 2 n=1 Tax=Nomascus leucogenys TaxID=61853 RepID=A0A2I3GK58_NOMLE
MSFCPNQPGETTHPSSGMLACSYKVIGITTPRLAVLTAQELWRIFQKYQSRVFFFCMPAPTIPREWTRVRNSGRK